MPGRYALTTPVSEIAAALGWQSDLPPDPPRANVAPGQEVLVAAPGGLTHMRWGMIPVGRVNARGRPVMETIVNARSETVFAKSAFDGVGRAVVPADAWYEWTGEKRRKTAWRIAPKEGGLLWFAAISDVWTAPGGREIAQVATVTCPPSGDVRHVHDRMGVLLELADVPVWLHGAQEDAAALMKTWPDGRLRVVEAKSVDWDGA